MESFIPKYIADLINFNFHFNLSRWNLSVQPQIIFFSRCCIKTRSISPWSQASDHRITYKKTCQFKQWKIHGNETLKFLEFSAEVKFTWNEEKILIAVFVYKFQICLPIRYFSFLFVVRGTQKNMFFTYIYINKKNICISTFKKKVKIFNKVCYTFNIQAQ